MRAFPSMMPIYWGKRKAIHSIVALSSWCLLLPLFELGECHRCCSAFFAALPKCNLGRQQQHQQCENEGYGIGVVNSGLGKVKRDRHWRINGEGRRGVHRDRFENWASAFGVGVVRLAYNPPHDVHLQYKKIQTTSLRYSTRINSSLDTRHLHARKKLIVEGQPLLSHQARPFCGEQARRRSMGNESRLFQWKVCKTIVLQCYIERRHLIEKKFKNTQHHSSTSIHRIICTIP